MNWKPLTEMPPTRDDGTGYESSETLLLWIKDLGPSFGYVVRTNGSKWRWRSNSYTGYEITHWAEIMPPNA